MVGDIEDDGIQGPVGDALGVALRHAGAQRGFAVRHPGLVLPWVDQGWRGRQLLIRPSSLGAQGRTSGYRWIAVRVSAGPFGSWADVVLPGAGRLEGTALLLTPHAPSPTGLWAGDPALGADLWAFATRLAPEPIREHDDTEAWLQLHVRPDAVLWHLRASRCDGDRLVEALDLLAHVAEHGEAHDAALSARLGTNPGVAETRRVVALGVAVVALATLVVVVLVAWLALRAS